MIIFQFWFRILYDTIEKDLNNEEITVKNSFFLLTFTLLYAVYHLKKDFANCLDLPVQSATAVEADTGKILYEKDSDKSEKLGGLSTLLTTHLIRSHSWQNFR